MIDIIGIILGRYLISFLGAVVRYFFKNVMLKMKGESFIPFSKLWSYKKNQYEELENNTSNMIAGVFVLATFFLIAYQIIHF